MSELDLRLKNDSGDSLSLEIGAQAAWVEVENPHSSLGPSTSFALTQEQARSLAASLLGWASPGTEQAKPATPQQLAILLKTGHLLTVVPPEGVEVSSLMRRAMAFAEVAGRMPALGLDGLLVDPGQIAAMWPVGPLIRLTCPNGCSPEGGAA